MIRTEISKAMDQLFSRQPTCWFAYLEGDTASLEKIRADGTVVETRTVPRNCAFKELNRLNRFRRFKR